MLLTESATFPYLLIAAAVAVVFGIARGLLVKLAIYTLIQALFFAFFPALLLQFISLIDRIREIVLR